MDYGERTIEAVDLGLLQVEPTAEGLRAGSVVTFRLSGIVEGVPGPSIEVTMSVYCGLDTPLGAVRDQLLDAAISVLARLRDEPESSLREKYSSNLFFPGIYANP